MCVHQQARRLDDDTDSHIVHTETVVLVVLGKVSIHTVSIYWQTSCCLVSISHDVTLPGVSDYLRMFVMCFSVNSDRIKSKLCLVVCIHGQAI